MPNLPHTAPDHDETLIARLAADDLPEDEREGRLARQRVIDCPACAELLTDLRAIVAATAALPSPRRTRDFRLTEADAARLRPGGWRGLLVRFGSPSFAFTRPVAMGLATLGIAGLLLASLPAGLGGSTASAPQELNAGGAPTAAAAPAASVPPGAPPNAGGVTSPAPGAAAQGPEAASPGGRTNTSSPPKAAGSPAPSAAEDLGTGGAACPCGSAAPSVAAEGSGSGVQQEAVPSTGPSPLVIASVALLVAGLGLAGLRTLARRVT